MEQLSEDEEENNAIQNSSDKINAREIFTFQKKVTHKEKGC
jgi:hypothetical protein